MQPPKFFLDIVKNVWEYNIFRKFLYSYLYIQLMSGERPNYWQLFILSLVKNIIHL